MIFQQSFGLVSQNPVLRNITDYLIEEASAEEEELLGQASETEDSDEKDQAMIKVIVINCSKRSLSNTNCLTGIINIRLDNFLGEIVHEQIFQW